MAKMVREVRGVPQWLIREYLKELGGEVQKDQSVVGYGWKAWLSEMDDYEIGSFSVAQVCLEAEGQEDKLEQLELGLKDKLLRAGA
jgi:hypothetical protein